MAQATSVSTTSPSCFHNHAADAIGRADAAHPPTRRAFIGAVAGLPVVAASPSATAQSLDANLIELGTRFEPLVDQYYVAQKHWARLMVSAHVEYRTMVATHVDQASFERRYQAMKDCCERWGADEALATLSAIKQKMEELATAINAAPVHSIAGLRAKAMVALCRSPRNTHTMLNFRSSAQAPFNSFSRQS